MQGPVKIDETVSVTGQIAPADVAEIAKAGFAAIINNRPDGSIQGHSDISHGMNGIGIRLAYPSPNEIRA
jgi:uncharacterized protein (TIGR01244 family)